MKRLLITLALLAALPVMAQVRKFGDGTVAIQNLINADCTTVTGLGTSDKGVECYSTGDGTWWYWNGAAWVVPPSASGLSTIQKNAAGDCTKDTLNFTGAGVTLATGASTCDVDIPAAGGGSALGWYVVTDAAYGASTSNSDNTAPVQLAIDAACADGGGTVLLPPGLWKFEPVGAPGVAEDAEPWAMLVDSCDNLVIRGSGRDVTIIQGGEGSPQRPDNNKTLIRIVNSVNFALEDVTLDGDLLNDAINWDNGWRGENVDYSRFQNGNAYNFENHAGSLKPNQAAPGSDCSDHNWIDNWYTVNANLIIFTSQNTTTGGGPHDCRNIGNQITNVKITEFATNCIELRGSDHTLIADSEFDGCRDGINLEEGSAYNIISNIHAHDADKCTGPNVCSGVKTTCNNFADACGGGNQDCTGIAGDPYFCCAAGAPGNGTCDLADELQVRPHDNLIIGSLFEGNGAFPCVGTPPAATCSGGPNDTLACDENADCGWGQGVKTDGSLRLTITGSVFKNNGLNGFQDENEWSDDTLIEGCVFDGNWADGIRIRGDGTRIIGGSATNNGKKGIFVLDSASGLEIGGFKSVNNNTGIQNASCTGLDAPYLCCSDVGKGSCDDADITPSNTFITRKYYIHGSAHGVNYANGPGSYRENTFIPILEAPHASTTNQAKTLVQDATTRSASITSGLVLESGAQYDRFFDLLLSNFAYRSATNLILRARVNCTISGGNDCLLRWRNGGPFVGGPDSLILESSVGTWQEVSQTVPIANIVTTLNDTCNLAGNPDKCTGGGAWDGIGGFWAKGGTAIEQIVCVDGGGSCDTGFLCCGSGPNAGLSDNSNTCTIITVDNDCRQCTDDTQCQVPLYGLRVQGADDTFRVDGYSIETIEGTGGFTPDANPAVDHTGYVAGHGDGLDCLVVGEWPKGVAANGDVQGCAPIQSTLTTAEGIIALATQAEVNGEAEIAKAVTPATLGLWTGGGGNVSWVGGVTADDCIARFSGTDGLIVQSDDTCPAYDDNGVMVLPNDLTMTGDVILDPDGDTNTTVLRGEDGAIAANLIWTFENQVGLSGSSWVLGSNTDPETFVDGDPLCEVNGAITATGCNPFVIASAATGDFIMYGGTTWDRFADSATAGECLLSGGGLGDPGWGVCPGGGFNSVNVDDTVWSDGVTEAVITYTYNVTTGVDCIVDYGNGVVTFTNCDLVADSFDSPATASGGCLTLKEATGGENDTWKLCVPNVLTTPSDVFTVTADGYFPHEIGGLEADLSAYDGLIDISAGVTSNVTNLAELNTALGGAGIVTGDHTAPEVNDLTSVVTWANVPNGNITQVSVTQHEAALSITESQISNLSHVDGSKVLKTGDTMTGNLIMDKQLSDSPVLRFAGLDNVTWEFFKANAGNFTLQTSPEAIEQTLELVNPHGAGVASLLVEGNIIGDYDGGAANNLTLRFSADCFALTDGVNNEPCYDTVTNTIWVCETADLCNNDEWINTGGGGGGEVNDGENLGGGLANYVDKPALNLRFNTFAGADFDLTTNLFTIDALKWATRAFATGANTTCNGDTCALNDDTTNLETGGNSTSQLASTEFVQQEITGRPHVENIIIYDPSTLEDTGMVDITLACPGTATLSRVWCSTKATNVTINFQERTEAVPGSGGVDMLTSDLICDTNSQATTTFSNQPVANRAPVNLEIVGVGLLPGVVRIHVEYTCDS